MNLFIFAGVGRWGTGSTFPPLCLSEMISHSGTWSPWRTRPWRAAWSRPTCSSSTATCWPRTTTSASRRSLTASCQAAATMESHWVRIIMKLPAARIPHSSKLANKMHVFHHKKNCILFLRHSSYYWSQCWIFNSAAKEKLKMVQSFYLCCKPE